MSAVDSAVRAAVIAAPAARRASDAERAGWLVAVADALDAASTELVALADAETHLGSPRLPGEVARTTAQLRLFASVVQEGSYLEAVVDHADATTTPPRPDLRRVLVPLGPVAVYAASNFPFAFSVAGGDTASALAVGCPVVVKAHPGHPRTSLRVAQIVTEALAAAGAPTGVFGMVEGYQEGIDLVEHPGITAAAFTGSVRGGRALADRAAARPAPIPFFGELGSANPVVVTAAADAARGGELATGLAGSFTLGVGQFCTKPGIVFVPEGSALEQALPAAVTAPAATMLTGSIADGFVQGSTALAEVAGVQTLRASNGAGDPGVYAVDSAVFVAQRDVLGAEVFGPATLLVRYGDRDDLLTALDGLEGSLTATLHSETDDDVDAVLDALVDRSGRVLFAGWPTGVAVSWAQQHGGPWPATTSQHTSVGATAVRRFQRPVAFQDAPERLLPLALREGNPLGVPRRVDGVYIA
ncbi:aldehyde dehydrogenase family protein [Rathayibacter sp. SD072]|uniref:aldehyde dehydrogenase family protein n=1 Tax=Rathayibacter sp. SD072 TaxID=2781731 RepID=UPI001A973BAE|nr:aldehyde dehydrogenase family protein [Rathayibacter sp. SD072]MBO0985406.1 aldehyde dehydrogenase family protein [Rathayibacter sp. SD072]